MAIEDVSPNNFPDDYNKDDIDSRVKIRTDAIAGKAYGDDVRGAIQDGIDIASVQATEATSTANEAKTQSDSTEARFNNEIAGKQNDSEVVDARRSTVKNKNYDVLGDRLNDNETDFAAVTDNVNAIKDSKANSTDKSGIADNAYLLGGANANSIMSYQPRTGAKILAHQGNSKMYPGNSIRAFETATRFDGFDTDIQCTSDGVWYCFHDDTLDNTTTISGSVNARTASDMNKARLKSGTGLDLLTDTEKQIPTLETAIQYAKWRDFVIDIEIKTPNSVEYSGSDYDNLINIIHRYGIEKNVIIESFSETALQAVYERDPLIHLDWLTTGIDDRNIDIAKNFLPNAGIDLGYSTNQVTQANVDKVHAAGLSLNVWTITDQVVTRNVRNMGADFITTNTIESNLRYDTLALKNYWDSYGNGLDYPFVEELAPGIVHLYMVLKLGKAGDASAKANTLICTLPDWAAPFRTQWKQMLYRTKDGVQAGSVNICGRIDQQDASQVQVGVQWKDISSWAVIDCIWNVAGGSDSITY